jgi:hypothetical protein
MEENLVTLQMTAEYRDKLRILAKDDIRSMKGEFEWLIDQEALRRGVPLTVSMETAPGPASQAV